MLKTYHIKVMCPKDNVYKVFRFTVADENRLGLRMGCNDRSVCQTCNFCCADTTRQLRSRLGYGFRVR